MSVRILSPGIIRRQADGLTVRRQRPDSPVLRGKTAKTADSGPYQVKIDPCK